VGIPKLQLKLAKNQNNSEGDTQMNYIGTDVHISTLEFKVVNDSGKIKMDQVVQTSAPNFLTFVKSVPKPRKIFIEEGPLSAWLLELSVKNNEHLVITDPKRNRWIGSSGKKADPIDAGKLAQLARGGFIKEIYHPVGQRRQFRELITAYHDTVRDTVRIKNKIKAKFLQRGIQCSGQTVYLPEHRTKWREKLPQEPALLIIIDSLWQQLDQIQQNQEAILARARAQAKDYPEVKLIDEIPGVGFIIAVTIVAILENPNRFANKRKVWSYAGLGIDTRSSANKIYAEHLSKDYNRLLKCVVEEAAQAAVNANNENALRRTYLEMTIQKGILPYRAILTISRDIIAAAWAMWKKNEHYNPDVDKKKIAEVA
jgi:transposase